MALIFGLCLGSFSTALIYRVPRKIPWIFQSSSDGRVCRSRCPSCGVVLGVRDLIPLFSWLATRGKCRHCGVKIGALYPSVELITALLVGLQFWAWGLSLPMLPVLFSIPFFVAASVIDWEHMILPDEMNAVLTAMAGLYLLARVSQADWDWALAADHAGAAALLVIIFYGISSLLRICKGREALGQGDLKFLPCAGLFLGMAALPGYLVLSGLLGLLVAFLKRSATGDKAFPFGPALIFSVYFHLFLTGLGFDYTW